MAAELLAEQAHGRRVNDRGELLDVVDEQPEECRFVPVLQVVDVKGFSHVGLLLLNCIPDFSCLRSKI